MDFLLLPKLLPPRPLAALVARERLVSRLDQALTYRLTLLSASAGFGKTTLLSTWVAHCPYPVAWLSLEEHDNDPLHFWSYVVAALRVKRPTFGDTALSMLQAPQPPALTIILTTLINELASSLEEMVLILDDYHIIDDPTIVSSLQFLFDHLPSTFHLILSGRSDPQLALPRLRARGQIVEIRDRDLRFTREETVRFLVQTMGLSLADTEVDVLAQRTEGWIAGLQLAALAMRTREDYATFVRQLSGSQRFIMEYMQEEILERQPQALQDFLLHTSILTRLHASLCQAVTAGASEQESQRMLRTLEKANLFLVPLDEEQHWYRLHSLFRDVLQVRLHAVSPELVPVLHQRAARWYAQQGDVHEAIIHALTGTDYTFAADLMEQSSEQMWLGGESAQLHIWIRQLPDPLMLAHARLALTTALQFLFQTFYAPDEQWNQAAARAEETIARLEPLLEKQEATALPETERHVLRNRLGLLRRWIATRAANLREDVKELGRLGSEMWEMAREDDVVWKMLPTFSFLVVKQNWISLMPMLSELKRQAEMEQHNYEAAWITSLLGEAYRDMGQLPPAHQAYSEALQRLRQMGKARSMFGYVQLHLGELHWYRNELMEARSFLDAVLDFAQTWQHMYMWIDGYYSLIRVLLAQGACRGRAGSGKARTSG